MWSISRKKIELLEYLSLFTLKKANGLTGLIGAVHKSKNCHFPFGGFVVFHGFFKKNWAGRLLCA